MVEIRHAKTGRTINVSDPKYFTDRGWEEVKKDAPKRNRASSKSKSDRGGDTEG